MTVTAAKKFGKTVKLRAKKIDKGKSVCYNIQSNKCFGEGGLRRMSTIRVGDNENLESALRRFKRKCSRDGIIGDLRKKEFYEKPSVKKRKKSEAARKRSRN